MNVPKEAAWVFAYHAELRARRQTVNEVVIHARKEAAALEAITSGEMAKQWIGAFVNKSSSSSPIDGRLHAALSEIVPGTSPSAICRRKPASKLLPALKFAENGSLVLTQRVRDTSQNISGALSKLAMN